MKKKTKETEAETHSNTNVTFVLGGCQHHDDVESVDDIEAADNENRGPVCSRKC